MHPIISSQMKAFAEENDIGGAESDKFEIYSVFSVLNGRFGKNVGPADGHLKGTEFGIDGVALFINGEFLEDRDSVSSISKIYDCEIHFLQSKTSSGYDYGEFAKFIDATQQFIDGNNRGASVQLKQFGELYDAVFEQSAKWTKNPKLFLTYIFTGVHSSDGNTIAKIETFKKYVRDLSLFSEVNIEIVGASELQKYYRRATESSIVTFDFKYQITMPDNDKVKESYIGFLPIKELMKIVSVEFEDGVVPELNRKIFYDNVRDYDSESSINKSIATALLKNPSSFVFRNNGVTIVARNSNRTGDRFNIESYQVVNGCQTCNIIFENYSDAVSEVTIPLRLIVSQDDDFINSIIIGTNKQNPVREEQFWALRPFLKQFEEFASVQGNGRALFFERRENQYRFQNVPEKTRIIEPAALMKSVVSMYLHLPHRAGRDYREIKKEFSEMLFAEGHDVQLYHAAAFSYYKLEFCYRTGRISSENKKYRMYYIWAIGAIAGVTDNIFNIKTSKAAVVSNKIYDICDEDEKIVSLCVQVTSLIEETLRINGLNQDQLRNESASELIRKEITQNIIENRIQ
jgi:hypothetical protein